MDERTVAEWLDGYVRAWGSYDPDEVGALFSQDAVYAYNPFDEPGTYEAHYQPVLVAGDQAVAHGYSRYFDTNGTVADEYDNLFLLRFDASGRCSSYQEWYMQKPTEDEEA